MRRPRGRGGAAARRPLPLGRCCGCARGPECVGPGPRGTAAGPVSQGAGPAVRLGRAEHVPSLPLARYTLCGPPAPCMCDSRRRNRRACNRLRLTPEGWSARTTETVMPSETACICCGRQVSLGAQLQARKAYVALPASQRKRPCAHNPRGRLYGRRVESCVGAPAAVKSLHSLWEARIELFLPSEHF